MIANGELIVNGESSLQEGVPSMAMQRSALGPLLITRLINYLAGSVKLVLEKFTGNMKADVQSRMDKSIVHKPIYHKSCIWRTTTPK